MVYASIHVNKKCMDMVDRYIQIKLPSYHSPPLRLLTMTMTMKFIHILGYRHVKYIHVQYILN